MRSQMVESSGYIQDKHLYTDLMVCKSAAGYYIGTMYNNPDGFQEPGSRDSVEYWPNQADAETALATGEWTQRLHP